MTGLALAECKKRLRTANSAEANAQQIWANSQIKLFHSCIVRRAPENENLKGNGMEQVYWYRPLPPRGTIALVAPASPPRSADDVDKAVRYLEQLGYRVEVGPSCFEASRVFSVQQDRERAQELQSFFENPGIDAIFSLRGGYGGMRLLHLLDYRRIAATRKLFVGFSDLTALQIALFQSAQLVTVSAPFPYQLAAIEGTAEEQFFWDLVTGKPPAAMEFLESHRRGSISAQGFLLCGNLTLFAALCGTAFLPQNVPVVGCFEDVNEAPYRIDRLFRQLWLARMPLSGLLLGRFQWRDAEQVAMQKVLSQVITFFDLPTLYGINYGHHLPSRPLPFGVPVTLNPEGRRLELRHDRIIVSA